MTRVRRPSFQYNAEAETYTIKPRAGFTTLDPPARGRIGAFEQAHMQLAVAAEVFECLGDQGVAGTRRAVAAAYDYFIARGIPDPVLSPLLNVIRALADAEMGIENPTFKLAPRAPGKPRKPTRKLEFEGLLAAVAECCVRHFRGQGMRPYREPAYRMAAKLISDGPLGVQKTATEICELRERVMRAKPGSPDRQNFDILVSIEASKVAPLETARQLARHDNVIGPE